MKSQKSPDPMQNRQVLLVGSSIPKEKFQEVSKFADVYYVDELDAGKLDKLLPKVDCFLGGGWSRVLGKERISKMSRLKFIQSISAGVNRFPFEYLDERVVLSSNAGGYSEGVGEYAIALLLAAAKRVEWFDTEIKNGNIKDTSFVLRDKITVLNGKTLGILGYGGIGGVAGRIGKAFGMRICAFSRHDLGDPDVKVFKGREGLLKVLKESDAIIVALPLTKHTEGIIGKKELSVMKPKCIMVNIGRGEIVNEKEIYQHLSKHPDFVYSTDVWWTRNGKESVSPELPFLKLENFIGTPHISGPSAHNTGEPVENAIGNLLRFLRGEKPKNIVDRSEYV